MWQLILDLALNRFTVFTEFLMETTRSVLQSIHQEDMFSIDLKDAYPQVSILSESRHFQFVCQRLVYQFKVLCFSLITALQVFTGFMAPLPAILHHEGVQILRYLNDWLVLGPSLARALLSRDKIQALYDELGILINHKKLDLFPSQEAVYFRMKLDSATLNAFPTQERIQALLRELEELLSHHF